MSPKGSNRHHLHHDSQFGGLANRRTSDHILHLASLIGGQTSGYTPPPSPPATVPQTLLERIVTSPMAVRVGIPPPDPPPRPFWPGANVCLTLTLTLMLSPTPTKIVEVVLTTSILILTKLLIAYPEGPFLRPLGGIGSQRP